MRRRWYILAVLAGVLAAAIVWGWPVGPRWRSGPDVGRLEGFSPDGRTLVTCRVPSPVNNAYPNPEVCRWDAATGKLLGRVELPCIHPYRLKEVRPSADGLTLLVGEGGPLDASRGDFYMGDWYLHDGVTGRRTAGPIPGVAMTGAFSPDGRWLVGIRGQPPPGGFKSLPGFDIFSAATGELVLGLPDRDGLVAKGCFFDPDGTTAAVDWVPKDQKDNNQHTVQVVELPSGQERRRFELPQRPWVKITKWDGQRLEAIVSSPAGPANESLWSTCLFDLSHDPVGDGVEDPLGHGDVDGAKERFWQYGPDWVAYIRVLPPPGPPTKVQLWKDWLLAKIGMGRAPASGLKVTARFVDRASGATRYELPSPLQLSCFVE